MVGKSFFHPTKQIKINSDFTKPLKMLLPSNNCIAMFHSVDAIEVVLEKLENWLVRK